MKVDHDKVANFRHDLPPISRQEVALELLEEILAHVLQKVAGTPRKSAWDATRGQKKSTTPRVSRQAN